MHTEAFFAWEQRKLGATNTFFTDGNYGEAYPKSSDMTDSGSGIPFLTGGNLKDGKLSLDGASYITPEKHSKLTSGHLLEDDIVIAVRGSLGALGYVNTDNSGWNINSQLAILRTDKSELYGKFLIQYLLSWTGQNELLKRQTGSALKQLPIGAIKDVEVPITSIAEQGKIGEYFADLDNLITLHQRKCDETKRLKKYMLQKMFPQNGEKVPEIRFSGFTDDWEQRKLGDVVEVCSGRDYKHLDAGDIPVYGTGGYMLSVSEALSYDEDAIGIGRKGTIDKPYILKAPFWTVDTLFYCVPKEKYDLNFAFDLFQNINWKTMDESTGVPSLSKTIINKVEILAATLPEQQKIGNYFNKLDNLITLHQRELENLQNIKKFMLEKMFV